MKKVRIYGKKVGGSRQVVALTGDVMSGGDAWTLVTGILRNGMVEARVFTLNESRLNGNDRLGGILKNDNNG